MSARGEQKAVLAMVKTVRLWLPFLLLITALGGCGGGSNNAVPSAFVGPAVPGAQQEQIDALLGALVGQPGSTSNHSVAPGVEVAVAKNGLIVYAKAYGFAQLPPTMRAMDNATGLQIGSVSKQFTAACVLLLQQRGSLSIDDSLAKYIPEMIWSSQITLRNLLTMESGLPDRLAGAPPIDEFGVNTEQEFVDVANKLKALRFTPGTAFEYSDINYDFLAMVVERVSGLSIKAFLQEQLFTPLGLTQSSWDFNPAYADNAMYYLHVGSVVGPFGYQEPINATSAFGDGAIVSNASQLVLWDWALTQGRLLNATQLSLMFAPNNVPPSSGPPSNQYYAMGWLVGPGIIWHNGEDTGVRTMNAMFNDGYDVAVIGSTETDDLLSQSGALISNPSVSAPECYADLFYPENLAVQVHNIVNPANSLPIFYAPAPQSTPAGKSCT